MVIKRGDLIKFYYTGKFQDGKIFASTRGKKPAECKVGEGKFIRDIEIALVGMEVSEKKEIVIPSNRYGQRDETLVKKFSKNTLEGMEVEVGQVIKLENKAGGIFNARVLAIESDTVTLDLNHPLAGKTVKFDIEVMEIRN